MTPTQPNVPQDLLPEGSREIVIAEHQREYLSLPSVRTSNKQTVTRWELTAEERAAIADGADLFITVLNSGPLQPLRPSVGMIDWKPCPLCNAPEGERHDYRCPLS